VGVWGWVFVCITHKNCAWEMRRKARRRRLREGSSGGRSWHFSFGRAPSGTGSADTMLEASFFTRKDPRLQGSIGGASGASCCGFSCAPIYGANLKWNKNSSADKPSRALRTRRGTRPYLESSGGELRTSSASGPCPGPPGCMPAADVAFFCTPLEVFSAQC